MRRLQLTICVAPEICRWRNVEFVVKRVKAAKDNFILGEVDDVMQVGAAVCARGGGCPRNECAAITACCIGLAQQP